MSKIDLILGDCLEKMKDIPDNAIDMVLTDPPYGTTACKWDSIIDFNKMWEQLHRITKDNGAICLFGSEPFSSSLRMSNIKNYKYDWIWNKCVASNFAVAKYQPLKEHEIISVFSKATHNYFPIKEPRRGSGEQRSKYKGSVTKGVNQTSGLIRNQAGKMYNAKLRNPGSVLEFNPRKEKRGLHPTQKPVSLLEYLINTYTTKGNTVLDFTMGSGSTAIACRNTNRNFIGIEYDECYYKVTKLRYLGKIDEAREMRKNYGK